MMQKEKLCLLIYSLQKEFLPVLQEGQRIVDHCCWLIDLAGRLGIPVVIVNHSKLGEPIRCLLNYSGVICSTEVTTFSCLEDSRTCQLLEGLNKEQFLLAGAETHIALLQSAAALKSQGKTVFLVEDACTTRHPVDHRVALQRLPAMGMISITREMLFFECLQRSDVPSYRELSLTFLDQRYLRLE